MGFLVFTLVGIATGLIMFPLTLLARNEEAAVAVTVLFVIVAFAMTMLAWTQTLRYTASMAGYRPIDRMPPFSAAWLASTVAGFFLTIALLLVFAVIAFLALLSLGLAHHLWERSFEGSLWSSLFAPKTLQIWIIGYLVLSNLVMGCWTIVLTPIVCGAPDRRGAYSAKMIFARLFIAVPFFTAVAIGLAYVLTSATLEAAVQSVKPNATTLSFVVAASLFPGWLGMGWIMSFEALLLAGLPTISKAEIRAFEGSPSPARRQEIRALRKKWQEDS
ncbi:MAG: hypothetical protein AAF557_10845 [Pseudomonadota bacterium]